LAQDEEDDDFPGYGSNKGSIGGCAIIPINEMYPNQRRSSSNHWVGKI